MILAMKTLHQRGISVGDVSLNDVFVDQNYLVQLRPKVLENLSVISVSDFEKAGGQFLGFFFSSGFQTLVNFLLAIGFHQTQR